VAKKYDDDSEDVTDRPVSLTAMELNTDLDIGSMVEVDIPGYATLQYGVIRWMGYFKDRLKPIVGIELVSVSDVFVDIQLVRYHYHRH